LTTLPAVATICTTDVQRSFEFYTGTLGLKKVELNKGTGNNDGYFVVSAGGGTNIFVYERPTPPTAENTAITFLVRDGFTKVVNTLRDNGIKFETYDDENGITTDKDGIAKDGDFMGAWFKDPDGNIVAVMQTPSRK
jgi:catechol 2,3-dioxygenase-like lactoylglutathione lyase family enzyme